MNNKPSSVSYLGLIFFLIVNLAGLPVWFIIMAFGVGDFKSQTMLEIIFFSPISLYPIFIFVFSITSLILNANGKEGKAAIVMLLPLIISGGYILIGILLAKIF